MVVFEWSFVLVTFDPRLMGVLTEMVAINVYEIFPNIFDLSLDILVAHVSPTYFVVFDTKYVGRCSLLVTPSNKLELETSRAQLRIQNKFLELRIAIPYYLKWLGAAKIFLTGLYFCLDKHK